VCFPLGPFDRYLQGDTQRAAAIPSMARPQRFLFVAGAVAIVALGGAAHASACGSGGYSYAGVGAAQPAFGISATVASVEAFAVLHGHVAGWVGVGGPGEGPRGTNEWLQVGLSAFPGLTGGDLYYEVAQPSHFPVYHQVDTDLPAGEPFKLSVLEMHRRPDWWRVWVNRRPVSRAIHLPESYERWAPIASAESWDGGTGGACNTFLYRFHGVRLAAAPGGGWHPLLGGYPIRSSVSRIRRSRGSFLAAEGAQALQLLHSLKP
jgi:hypothetical protein